jgi:uncharacterized protein YodC (DUF2158 family)
MTLCPTCQRPIDSAALPLPVAVADVALPDRPVGAVVTLKAGGARMTVVGRDGSEARVAWTDDMGRPQELTVDVRALGVASGPVVE